MSIIKTNWLSQLTLNTFFLVRLLLLVIFNRIPAERPKFRGTQQTVSVNICSGNLLTPTIFGLKYDEKLEFSLAQNWESNACYFRKDKNVVWGKKKGQLAFSKGQPRAARKFG